MNKKIKIFLCFLLVVIILLRHDFPISETEIVGAYVNNNFNEEPFYAETPYIKDTLKLKADKTFTSKFYGVGTYKFESGIFANKLSITYEYEMGKAGADFNLRNRLFQPIKIMLVYDLNYYYEKIK